jgi:hypothetical protein
MSPPAVLDVPNWLYAENRTSSQNAARPFCPPQTRTRTRGCGRARPPHDEARYRRQERKKTKTGVTRRQRGVSPRRGPAWASCSPCPYEVSALARQRAGARHPILDPPARVSVARQKRQREHARDEREPCQNRPQEHHPDKFAVWRGVRHSDCVTPRARPLSR